MPQKVLGQRLDHFILVFRLANDAAKLGDARVSPEELDHTHPWQPKSRTVRPHQRRNGDEAIIGIADDVAEKLVSE